VKELKLTPNPNRPSSSSEGDSAAALFVCPLTLKEMNGGLPFVYLLTCGDVFSQAGLKAMATSPPAADKDEKETHQGEMSLCPQCNTKYDPREDVFAINPSPEEEERMIERMAIYLASKPIKSKKRKVAALKEEEEESKAKRRVIVPDTPRTPMMSAGMERRAARVVEGATEIHKTKVEKMSDAVKSLYRNKDQEKGAKPNWISQGTFTRVSLLSKHGDNLIVLFFPCSMRDGTPMAGVSRHHTCCGTVIDIMPVYSLVIVYTIPVLNCRAGGCECGRAPPAGSTDSIGQIKPPSATCPPPHLFPPQPH
jgi:hypothetical protein